MPKTKVERRVTSRFISSAHDVEMNAGEGMNPALLVYFDMKADTLIYCFVSSFADSI